MFWIKGYGEQFEQYCCREYDKLAAAQPPDRFDEGAVIAQLGYEESGDLDPCPESHCLIGVKLLRAESRKNLKFMVRVTTGSFIDYYLFDTHYEALAFMVSLAPLVHIGFNIAQEALRRPDV